MTLSVIRLTTLGCQEGGLEGVSFLIDLMYYKNEKIQYILTGGRVCVL